MEILWYAEEFMIVHNCGCIRYEMMQLWRLGYIAQSTHTHMPVHLSAVGCVSCLYVWACGCVYRRALRWWQNLLMRQFVTLSTHFHWRWNSWLINQFSLTSASGANASSLSVSVSLSTHLWIRTDRTVLVLVFDQPMSQPHHRSGLVTLPSVILFDFSIWSKCQFTVCIGQSAVSSSVITELY